MKLWIQFPLLFIIFICSTVYWMNMKHSWTLYRSLYHQSTVEVASIEPNRGIFFAETTEKLEISSLVACAIESASRTYPNRSIYFFMKGLTEDMTIFKSSFYKAIPLLSSIRNVYILPLNFGNVFKDTPLLPWYQKVITHKERFWAHVSAEACRLALIWKYGGIYMDTNIISMKLIPEEDFIATETAQDCSSGVFGFQQSHQFLWGCMEDYVKNYEGAIWGQQCPHLLIYMMKRLCHLDKFQNWEDSNCKNISILYPQNLYRIPYPDWGRYFEIWDPKGTFADFHAIPLLNIFKKNNAKLTTINHCPLTYKTFVKNEHINETKKG
ncbi:alpha-1,4-N-acetylglucosaminyltransferase-like [Rhinatrema bivittatum]|uniref:alpha-1,4-N-acetylglucosaminyltransferase-like n=1 Tax=Rhinatrema bivittatum TaxID=194408 RepID=UPI00112C20EE|nr:alpha-1,4-N-acetylglucosaminyltransferase-like [Rhinatrema bivittatum]